MATDNNTFKIVIPNGNSAQPKEEASKAMSLVEEFPTSKRKAKNGKRKAAESTNAIDASTGTSVGRKSGQKSAKKSKYERKTGRIINYENGLQQWAGLRYQPNVQYLQTTLSQQFEDSSPALIHALASAYTFNENLSFTRSRVRKEYVGQSLRKALSRPQFTQNQMFYGVNYKPGPAFIHYQNYVGKSSSTVRAPAQQRIAEVAKKPAAIFDNQVPVSTVEPVPTANTNPVSSENFVCGMCKRTDAKKYAKNLCQTCYKKQKKVLNGNCEDSNTKGGFDKAEENGAASVNADSIALKSTKAFTEKLDAIPLALREWNGTCPDCNRYTV